MADLVVIGYDDEGTASIVEQEARLKGECPMIEPDAIAVIARDGDGNYRVQTNYHPVTASGTWGIFWDLLFASFFFIPVLGMAVGPGLAELMRSVEGTGMEGPFEDELRDIVQPGTSALFLVTAGARCDEVTERLREHGGRIATASLSDLGTQGLRDQLHGEPAVSRAPGGQTNGRSSFG